MGEGRKVDGYISTTLRSADTGLVAEVQGDFKRLDGSKERKLALAFAAAAYYARLGIPTITAAILSLTPGKAWAAKAEILSDAYRTRAEKTREHLEEQQTVDPRLDLRNQKDLVTAAQLLELSQKGRRTKPQGQTA